MRKVMTVVLVLAAAILTAAYFVLPHFAPPFVERLIVAKLAEFGVVVRARMTLDCRWRNGPGYTGLLRVSVPDSPWCVQAAFGASCCEWEATVSMPETAVDQSDPLLGLLLERILPKGVTGLTFSGSVALEANAVRTFSKPVPVWKVTVPIRDVSASAMANDQERAVGSLSATLGASGIADHVDIAPVFLRARSAAVGGFSLTNLFAKVRVTERMLTVDEASAGFCGGKVNVYSLFLDPAKLNTGFTLFFEDVEAGETLAHVNGFQGEATGRLHGKAKAFVREGGRAIRLNDMFLYSTPGETGKLKMADPSVVTDNLSYAGIDDSTRANVSDALSDLDYKVLRFDLRRQEGDASRLTVQISGSATRGTTTVPVDLTINLNGAIEQLVNTGLGYSAKLKGKKK